MQIFEFAIFFSLRCRSCSQKAFSEIFILIFSAKFSLLFHVRQKQKQTHARDENVRILR